MMCLDIGFVNFLFVGSKLETICYHKRDSLHLNIFRLSISRARSTDRADNRPIGRQTGRPKGRSRSLPRRKPAKAIADRASVFANPSDEPPMHRQDIEDHIRASSGRPLQASYNRRSMSPRTVSQKVSSMTL